MSKTALLLGAYGQTNLGDDILLYNYLSYLRQEGFEKMYINASKTQFVPEIIKDTFPEVEVFETYRTSPLKMLGMVRRADAVCYGGGTVYKELYATTGRAPYTVIAGTMVFNIMARLMGTKVYGLHIGIGSIKTGLGRFFSRWALKASSHTIFRDETSYQSARDTLRVPLKQIDHSTDGLFLSKQWQKTWNSYTLSRPKNKKTVVGVNVLSDIPDWIDRDHYIATMRQFVTTILDDGAYVVLIPFQTNFNPTNDLRFIQEEIVPHLGERTNYTVCSDLGIDTVVSCLQQLDVLVGMRLHSLLLATVVQTPFVAVCYDTKCWRFVSEAEYEHAIKLEETDDNKLYELYTTVLRQQAQTKKQLAVMAEENYKEMDRCMEKIDL